MNTKIFDSELKVMEIVWREGDITAKQLALIAKDEIGWSKTTTYTVIKKCVDKGMLEKIMPGFLCRANVTREEVQEFETSALVKKLYHGETDKLVAALVENKKLSKETLVELKALINEMNVE